MAPISVIIPFVIVDDETLAMTKECIDRYYSLLGPDDEIVCIDDGSSYAHPFNGPAYRHLRIITTDGPSGNAHVWNLGAQAANHDLLLFSDNDVLPLVIQPMVESVCDNAVIFPVVHNEKIGIDKDHLAGECFIVTRATYEMYGPFNEEYGSYFEDTEFFKRVQNGDGDLKIAEGALVRHKSQGTFKKIMSQEDRLALFNRNRKLYEDKYGLVYPFLTIKKDVY